MKEGVFMEQEPAKEAKEDIESILDSLYEREAELFKKYIELFGEPSEELRDRDYAVGMGAIASSDTEQAKKDLEEFIAFLESEMAKKSGTRNP